MNLTNNNKFIGEVNNIKYNIHVPDITQRRYGWTKGYIEELKKEVGVRIIDSNTLYLGYGSFPFKPVNKYSNIVFTRSNF